jgi:hypothetical protein
MSAPPGRIRITHDDYHASHIGRTSTGDQFFATTPFVPALKNPGREFIAVYLFYADGRLKEALIDDLGTRDALDNEARMRLFERRLAELGAVEYCDIEVAPFEIERFGVEFGLIPRPPEEEGSSWWVILMPGDYMAFSEPFDGEYDT